MGRGGLSLWWGVCLGVLGAGCTTTLSAVYLKPTAIQTVTVGDAMAQVKQKLGSPKDAWPAIITAEGHEQVVWVYDTGDARETSWVGAIQPSRRSPVSLAQQHRVNPLDDAGYLVVFIDGRVSEVVRQH